MGQKNKKKKRSLNKGRGFQSIRKVIYAYEEQNWPKTLPLGTRNLHEEGRWKDNWELHTYSKCEECLGSKTESGFRNHKLQAWLTEQDARQSYWPVICAEMQLWYFIWDLEPQSIVEREIAANTKVEWFGRIQTVDQRLVIQEDQINTDVSWDDRFHDFSSKFAGW